VNQEQCESRPGDPVRKELRIAGRDKSSRWTVGSAGVVMIVTAGFHAAGYRPLVEQLAASNIQAAWLAGVKGLWLVFSLHLVIVGSLFLLAGIRPGCVGKTVLLIAGLVPVGDAIVLFSFVGIFVGTVALALAALLLYWGLCGH